MASAATSSSSYSFPVPRSIRIIAKVLPKIIPRVHNNHEELFPIIVCAIERHCYRKIRKRFTKALFTMIDRPNKQQRRDIINAFVTLARNVGEIRTEIELLPQCLNLQQINQMIVERRLLVAQLCGELARFVRPEIRQSLILSTLQELIKDSAVVVRVAALHSLILVIPLFTNTDKYFKVEKLMFQLIIKDPSRMVVQTTIENLIPALLKWGNQLEHILHLVLSNILTSIQSSPLVSGIEHSLELSFHVLGERQRYSVDVLLQLLFLLLPLVHEKSFDTCPYPSLSDHIGKSFPLPLLQKYAELHVDWPIFEWLHDDCFPALIYTASLLPQGEDKLRTRISNCLLDISKRFGDDYLTHIMLPFFLAAVGDNADLGCFPSTSRSKLEALNPGIVVNEIIASACVLPVMLGGVLGSSSKLENLREYIRDLLVQSVNDDGQSTRHTVGVYNSIRCLCSSEEHLKLVFDIFQEMVEGPNMDVKIKAAQLTGVIVPYINAKVVSTHILPSLAMLGSEPDLNVLYASINAFGMVAKNFKTDEIVEKIRDQMDAFLEDWSHKTMTVMIRALVLAVPYTTESLRDYLLSKIFDFTVTQLSSCNVMLRYEISSAICEAIRALDDTDLSDASVRDLLLPTIQNLLKDTDAVAPEHKDALEIIVKKRSRGILKTLMNVMDELVGVEGIVYTGFMWRNRRRRGPRI